MINLQAIRYVVALLAGTVVLSLAGCAEIEPKPFPDSEGHIKAGDTETAPPAAIPEVTTQTPILPEPTPARALEKYTVVVNEVPVKELLFALARDADLNVDLYPGIDGLVTLNAVDQTLPQILDRISRQVAIRYEFDDNNIIISADTPYFKSYEVDYVNMSRNTSAANQLSTQISTTGTTGAVGGGGGGSAGNNNSTTDVQSRSNNIFWQRLVANIAAVIGDPVDVQGSDTGQIPSTDNIIATPEAGTINVKATAKQHEYIQEYISDVVASAQRQVLIQATIVEVQLSDDYEAGINWQALDIAESSISIASNTLFNPIRATTTTIDSSINTTAGDPSSLLAVEYNGDDFSSLIDLLDRFGNTNVLSSPQLMVLNNQTAILKAVQNFVYFEIEADTTSTQTNAITTVDSEVRTVPIGVVMAVTPQISDSGVVTLNVRPTVSESIDQVPDPAIGLIQAQIAQNNPGNANVADIPPNLVPIIRVREMESMLRLSSGQTAVLGGLMQNRSIENDNAVPGLSDIPLLGRAFESRSRSYQKNELVIFLRPIIVDNPSLSGELADYRQYLDRDTTRELSEEY